MTRRAQLSSIQPAGREQFEENSSADRDFANARRCALDHSEPKSTATEALWPDSISWLQSADL
jgi:hypothetical protein